MNAVVQVVQVEHFWPQTWLDVTSWMAAEEIVLLYISIDIFGKNRTEIRSDLAKLREIILGGMAWMRARIASSGETPEPIRRAATLGWRSQLAATRKIRRGQQR
jgi:hypothetical protein